MAETEALVNLRDHMIRFIPRRDGSFNALRVLLKQRNAWKIPNRRHFLPYEQWTPESKREFNLLWKRVNIAFQGKECYYFYKMQKELDVLFMSVEL